MYSVVVALHIIAAVAAYGLPLTASLLVPWVRRHHPGALRGLHAAQYHFNQKLTGPGTVLLLAFGIYLATDRSLWGEFFVGFGIASIAIIAVVGGGVIVPATRDLARLDPASDAYVAVYRRYMRAEVFLGALVLATIVVMVVKPL